LNSLAKPALSRSLASISTPTTIIFPTLEAAVIADALQKERKSQTPETPALALAELGRTEVGTLSISQKLKTAKLTLRHGAQNLLYSAAGW
jgi:hypothetical protein